MNSIVLVVKITGITVYHGISWWM